MLSSYSLPFLKLTTAELVSYTGASGKCRPVPAALVFLPTAGYLVYRNIMPKLREVTDKLNNGVDAAGVEDEFNNTFHDDDAFKTTEGVGVKHLIILPPIDSESEKNGEAYSNKEFNFKPNLTTKTFTKPPPTAGYLKVAVGIEQVDSAYSEGNTPLKTLAGAISFTIAHDGTRRNINAKKAPTAVDQGEEDFMAQMFGTAKASTDTDEMKE